MNLLMNVLRILKNQHYRGNNSVKLEAEEKRPEKLFIYMYINRSPIDYSTKINFIANGCHVICQIRSFRTVFVFTGRLLLSDPVSEFLCNLLLG